MHRYVFVMLFALIRPALGDSFDEQHARMQEKWARQDAEARHQEQMRALEVQTQLLRARQTQPSNGVVYVPCAPQPRPRCYNEECREPIPHMSGWGLPACDADRAKGYVEASAACTRAKMTSVDGVPRD